MKPIFCFCVLMLAGPVWAGPESWTTNNIVTQFALEEWYRVNVSTNVPAWKVDGNWAELGDSGDGVSRITKWTLLKKQPTQEDLRVIWETKFTALKQREARAIAEKEWDADPKIKAMTKIAGKTKADYVSARTNEMFTSVTP